jgi:hypothetical protein
MQFAAACVREYLPGSQSVHASLPILFLYFPGAQAVHIAPISEYPTLQAQLLDAAPECEFAAQVKQTDSVVACVVVEYLPAGQSKFFFFSSTRVIC